MRRICRPYIFVTKLGYRLGYQYPDKVPELVPEPAGTFWVP